MEKKKVRLIFLDIDGVLNCELHYISKDFKNYKKKLRKDVKSKHIERMEYYSSQICNQRILWLNDLCNSTGAKVVISSTWRKSKTLDELKDIFTYCGATFEIIDKTGTNSSGVRGVEVYEWLENNCHNLTGIHSHDFKAYVIIDDDSDMLLNQQNHFFQTDTYSGLTPSICYKITRFFNLYTPVIITLVLTAKYFGS